MQGHSHESQPAETQAVDRSRTHSLGRSQSTTRIHRVHATLAKSASPSGNESPTSPLPNMLPLQSGETQEISDQRGALLTSFTNEGDPSTLSALSRALATEVDASLRSWHAELKRSVQETMNEHDASLKLWWHTQLNKSVKEAAKQGVQECLKQFTLEPVRTVATTGIRVGGADGPDACAGGQAPAPPEDIPKPPKDEAAVLSLEDPDLNNLETTPAPPGAITDEDAEQSSEEAPPLRVAQYKNSLLYDESDDEQTAEGSPRASCLKRIIRSKFFETSTGILIVLNCLFIGIQTQYLAVRATQDVAANRQIETQEPMEFFVLQIVFSNLFFVELVMRMVAEGPFKFVTSKEATWNLIDIVVVLLDMVNMILELAALADTTNFSVIRALRVIRVVRLVKVIRIMRFFRELRMMIYSILGSLKSLLWVIVVQCLMFSIFGVCFVTAVTTEIDSVELRKKTKNEEVLKFFGTLDRSFLALYMSMTGGDDWSVYYSAIADSLPWYYSVLYLLFITFALFAVVNIVTGVFVENAMQSSIKDRDFLVREELEQKKEYLKNMQALFEEMDKMQTGTIVVDAFEESLLDPEVTAYFRALKLDVSDARNLFKLLDYDASGEIDYLEFVEGCWKLQGEARGLDTKLIGYEVRFLRDQVGSMNSMLRAISQAQGLNLDAFGENDNMKSKMSRKQRNSSVFSAEISLKSSLKEDSRSGRGSGRESKTKSNTSGKTAPATSGRRSRENETGQSSASKVFRSISDLIGVVR